MALSYYESLKSNSDHDHAAGSDPFVGALVQRSDGTVWQLAHRANGQEGHHAEYSLIEEELSGQDLKGCKLFTTLEPCVSDVRTGTSCSELIVKTQIKDIYIGILDPDMRVYSKGICYLFKHGITVHPFSCEINGLIMKSCMYFKVQKNKDCDKICRVVSDVIDSKFDKDAVNYFLSNSKSIKTKSDLACYLLNKGYVDFDRKNMIVDNEVQLMFYKSKVNTFNSRECVFIDLRKTHGEEERAPSYFDGPLALFIEEFNDFCSKIGIKQNDSIYGPLKEAFVNATLHREYFKATAYAYVKFDGTSISFTNPIPSSFTDEKVNEIISFSTKPEPGNPILVDLGREIGLIEVQGKGLFTIKSVKPKPIFTKSADRILELSIKII